MDGIKVWLGIRAGLEKKEIRKKRRKRRRKRRKKEEKKVKKKKEKEEGMTVLTKLYGTKLRTEELHDLIWLSREYLNEIDCGKRVLPILLWLLTFPWHSAASQSWSPATAIKQKITVFIMLRAKNGRGSCVKVQCHHFEPHPEHREFTRPASFFEVAIFFFYCWTAQINSP